ncbi:hypothetical protein ILUMI_14810 [Ignelater luminosus]|uniref:Tc1-like transposase DDE domain-containing protein n=1 Tax=Ignelater luminosus TaxID=2038154 RepID=A0A8K0CVA8_IGNLU|nr:hypothetical protein ILUMI_14810 [Ignelater luminosus]
MLLEDAFQDLHVIGRPIKWDLVGVGETALYEKKHEAFDPDCPKRKVKFPALVMIWGSMSAKGRGKLHFLKGTVDTNKYLQSLEESLLPLMEKYLTSGQDFIFQQDGAACHAPKQSLKWQDDYSIPLLEWVSGSPDLSPIETLWHEMKKTLRKHPAKTIPRVEAKASKNMGFIYSRILPRL